MSLFRHLPEAVRARVDVPVCPNICVSADGPRWVGMDQQTAENVWQLKPISPPEAWTSRRTQVLSNHRPAMSKLKGTDTSRDKT